MQNFVENKPILSGTQLFDQFVHDDNKCFHTYKSKATIAKVLSKFNHIKKPPNKLEQRIINLINSQRNISSNRSKLVSI